MSSPLAVRFERFLKSGGTTAALAVAVAAAPGQERAEIRGVREDGIQGVREQHEAARQTANQLNRDARQETREQAVIQAASDPRTGNNLARDSQGGLRDLNSMNSGLRGADLGLWFSSRPGHQGLVISDVANQGAFAQAGFRENDRIVSVNGQPVTTEAQFVQMLLGPGASQQAATIVVLREGQQQTLTVLPAAVTAGIVAADPLFQAGLVLDRTNANQLVVQHVFPRTPAFYAGLRAGDVISGFNGQPISSVSALSQAISGGSGADLGLIVTRSGQDRQLALNLGAGSFGANGAVRTVLRPDTAAVQGVVLGTNLNTQTGQLGTNLTVPGSIGSTSQAGINSGVVPGTTIGGVTTGAASLPANSGAVGTGGAATTGTFGTATNPAAGAISSPTATGNPTSPSAAFQSGGIRTSTPGVPTAVPGLPTAGTSIGNRGALTPGVNSGATGGAGTFAPGINSGATGATGGAGSTAGGAGAVGGTGAVRGGAGSTAGGAGAIGGTGAVGGTGTGGSGGVGSGGSGAGGT